jgi:hypothetical protein
MLLPRLKYKLNKAFSETERTCRKCKKLGLMEEMYKCRSVMQTLWMHEECFRTYHPTSGIWKSPEERNLIKENEDS